MSEMIELNGRQIPQAAAADRGHLRRRMRSPNISIAASRTAYFRSSVRLRGKGHLGTADAVVPTFTNPNNVSIVTGAPPSVHGIAGNYCLDRESGREIMMTDESLMRSETILALMARVRRQDGRDHRQGQVAQAARAQPRRHLLFVRMRRSPKSRRSSAAAGPTCIRPICRCSSSMPGSRCSSGAHADAALSVAVRLRPARACAGRPGGRRLQPGARRPGAAARRAGRGRSASSPITA